MYESPGLCDGAVVSVTVMLSSRLPVLWICGAPATGKSTVAWRLFGDVDQLGMLYPAPEGDADRHLVKVAGHSPCVGSTCT